MGAGTQLGAPLPSVRPSSFRFTSERRKKKVPQCLPRPPSSSNNQPAARWPPPFFLRGRCVSRD